MVCSGYNPLAWYRVPSVGTSRADASRSEAAPAGGKNLGVFFVEREGEFVMSKSELLRR